MEWVKDSLVAQRSTLSPIEFVSSSRPTEFCEPTKRLGTHANPVRG